MNKLTCIHIVMIIACASCAYDGYEIQTVEPPEEYASVGMLPEITESMQINRDDDTFHDQTNTVLYDIIMERGTIAFPMSEGERNVVLAAKDGEVFHIAKHTTDYEYYYSVDNTMFYKANDEIDYLFESIIGTDPKAVTSSPEKTFTRYRYACSEPTTDADYINAAKHTVALWLDSLQDVTGEYALGSYIWKDYHEVIAAGMVNGIKEFVVMLPFDAEGTMENSVWKAKDGLSFGEFFNTVHSVIYARCYWRDGECGISDIKGDPSPYLTQGLTGIAEESVGYGSFFDFLNDQENQIRYAGVEYDFYYDYKTVSYNPVMLPDGRVVIVSIRLEDEEKRENNTRYGKAHQFYCFTDGKGIYNSPVEYNQQLFQPFSSEYTDGFKLVFDDYNSDGLADFTIKLDNDLYGSRYGIRYMHTDGSARIRPETRNLPKEVYMAGHFDDSIRLQKLSPDTFVTWSYDPATKDLTPDTPIDDYRMYNQKYYSSGNLKLYPSGTQSVICYFWNNTASPVTTGTRYDIGKHVNGEWIAVSTMKIINSKTVEAYSHGELTFDISDISAESGEYQIRLYNHVGIIEATFFLGTELPTDLYITAESDQLPAERTKIQFTINNTGISNISLPPTASLEKDGVWLSDVVISDTITTLQPGASKLVTVLPPESNGFFAQGEYTFAVHFNDRTYGATVTLAPFTDDERYGLSVVTAKKTDDGFDLLIKNNHWRKEAANDITLTDWVYILRDGEWLKTLQQ